MPARILVVDDEAPILFAMSEYFSSQSYQVDRAGTLKEAHALLSHRPDLAILDLGLNGAKSGEGLRLAALLREQDPHVPIILMTGFGSEEARVEAKRIGVNAFLVKPVPLSELGWRVTELLRERRAASGPQE